MMAAPETNRPAIPPSSRLAGQIAAVRAKKLAVESGAGGARLVSLLLAALGVGMAVDWWFDLAWGWRALWLCLVIGAAAAIVWREIVRPFREQPDDDNVALLVERHQPAFRSRLISALQLTRPGAVQVGEAPGLVRALVAETERIAQPLAFTDVIRTDTLRRRCAWASGLVVLTAVAFLSGGDVTLDLLQRALLSRTVEVPRKTRIVSLTGDLRMARGDDLTLTAQVRGVLPPSGRIVIRHDSGRLQEYRVGPGRTNRQEFALALESVPDSFNYTFHLGDSRRGARVETVERPGVATLEAEQIYPAYTGLGSVRRLPGDLTLLSGSQLNLKVTATKDVVRGGVKLVGSGQVIPFNASPRSARELLATISIPATNLVGFSVHLVDTLGFSSKDETVYRVDLLPDRAPVVRITYPERKEELVTAKATVLIGFEALDDFAVSQLTLRYSLDGAGERGVALNLDGPQRVTRRRYEWNLAALQPPLPEGASLEYWIEARDNNDVTGPGIGASERFAVRVVSEAEKRSDLMNRVGDSLGGLGETANEQEKLTRRLGEIIQGRPESRP